MFLTTDQFLPVNAVIRVNLELGEGSAEIPVICRVVYVRDDKSARAVGKPAGMGIEFLDMTAECLGLIEAYIAERITEVEGGVETALPAKRLSIMIVDDNHGCRTLAAQPFRTRGDYVRVAPDGFEALAQCFKETPDVIVCDVHMPRSTAGSCYACVARGRRCRRCRSCFSRRSAASRSGCAAISSASTTMCRSRSAARSCRRASIAWWRACSGRRTRSPRRRRCAATWRR